MTQQQLFNLDAPQQPARPVRAMVREVAQVAAPAAMPAARELWAAVKVPGEKEQAQVLAQLVQRAQSFSPRVAVESADAVLLELAGSQRLFGGLPALLAALRQAFPRPLQLALAPTPLAAVLLARAGRNCCITSAARIHGRLAPLPLQHLHWSEEELARLANMGVVTLGQLLRLPRAGLARRIGPERLRQLDRLTGQRADPRTAIPATERFAEQIHPDHETVDRERLLFCLQPVLTRLEEFLRARQRGVMALRLTLHHRHAPVICVLRCVVPEYRAARFSALLAAKLESLLLREPVRRMELAAGKLRHFAATGTGLWAPGEQGGDAAATHAPEFLQTLLARLGEKAVYGLAVRDEHRPEQQHRHTWPMQLRQAAPAAVAQQAMAESAQQGQRPLGLLPEPVPLQASCDASGRVRQLWHAGQELTLVSGPERIESGWWDGADVARDYYLARTLDGARWWIFRELAMPRRWFLHGCFA
jgi:protein ImuB